MSTKKENPHEGHRERMREKFLATGDFSGFAHHNLIEMLLFYASPRSDTNELAHALLKEFGSIKNLLDAPYDALINTKGIGTHSAILIKLIKDIIGIYNFQNDSNIKQVKSVQDMIHYLTPVFFNKPNETVVIMCLNKAGKLIKIPVISIGSIDSTQLDMRTLIFEVLSCHATKIVLAHNHPSGVCAPSEADIIATQAVAKALGNIKVTFEDHLIISGNDYFAFSEHQKTRDYLSTVQSDTFIADEETDKTEEDYARFD